MKAAVLRGTGDEFTLEDLRLRALGPRDVHVRVAASGVCHSDLSIQDGTIPHPLPAVLGHEGAGVVIGTGADVTTVEPGDHVVLAWVAPAARASSACAAVLSCASTGSITRSRRLTQRRPTELRFSPRSGPRRSARRRSFPSGLA